MWCVKDACSNVECRLTTAVTGVCWSQCSVSDVIVFTTLTDLHMKMKSWQILWVNFSVIPWYEGSCPSAEDTPGSPSSALDGASGVWCDLDFYCFPAHVLWLSEPQKHTGGHSSLWKHTNIWIFGFSFTLHSPNSLDVSLIGSDRCSCHFYAQRPSCVWSKCTCTHSS